MECLGSNNYGIFIPVALYIYVSVYFTHKWKARNPQTYILIHTVFCIDNNNNTMFLEHQISIIRMISEDQLLKIQYTE